jgi:hypothetical protein
MPLRDPNDTPTRDDEHAAKPLSFLVQAEARRVLSEAQLEGDPQRLADGWERRFIADRQRAEEMTALYEELGFEVAADPIRPEDMDDDCEDCQLLAKLQFQMIYTRRKPPT